MSNLRSDIAEEALRIAEAAEREKLALRLLGGVAVKLRAKDGLEPVFRREYADLDWISPKGTTAATRKLFESLGYAPRTRFNSIHGHERLLFFDERHGRQVDVFIGTFRMCHEIPLSNRITVEPVTIPLAELLLTKLQIIELNEKDVRDALALLHDHSVGDGDGGSINGARVARLCASDWGLWRTFTANLEKLVEQLDRYELPEESKQLISERVRELLGRIEEEPRTFGWKIRARIGDRKRWYDLPEEVDGGP